MSAQIITENFRRLARDAKIRLLQELWDEIADESASMPLSECQRLLLDERLRDTKRLLKTSNPGIKSETTS